jgi:arginyl-tRNA synthetase
MIKQEIIKIIEKATKEKDIHLEIPENPEHGDYSTNIALKLKKDPKEIIKKLNSPIFQKIEAAGPGFINFYLSNQYIINKLNDISTNFCLLNPHWQGKKVSVEFTDPNPFKELHLGHLYNNIVGETICRLLEAGGAMVKRINYQGDIGLHVAKAVWALKRGFTLENAYVEGNRAFENDPLARQEIKELNQKIYDKSDPVVNKIYERGRKKSLALFEKIYKRLGTKFDFYYFETEVGKIGKKIVEENLRKGIFENSQGAIIFPGEKYGLHKRVFITSQGLPTYEAKELGLAYLKYKDFTHDLSIIVTANEIREYFKVLITVMNLIYPEISKKIKHITHGMVRFKTGKMSSRQGNIIKAEDFLNQIKKLAKERAKNESVAEKIALAAVKYSLLKVGLNKDIIFDALESLKLEGDTGPYLQYTFARFKSILKKIGKFSKNKLKSLNLTQTERQLALNLLRFPDTIQEASTSFSPNVLTNYLHKTAMLANEFYHSHPVIEEKNIIKKQFKVKLVKVIISTLKQGLKILGIATLNKM